MLRLSKLAECRIKVLVQTRINSISSAFQSNIKKDVKYMIPNKKDEIKNLDDVKREYKDFTLDMLKDTKVKEFTKAELNILLETEVNKMYYDAITADEVKKCRCMYFGITAKVYDIAEACDLYSITEKQYKYYKKYKHDEWDGYHLAILNELNKVAEARGVYNWLWAVDHINDQMIKWGWDLKDIKTLMKRMVKAGYNPWSLTEDTVGDFIYSLPGHGFYEIALKDGKESFTAYDPTGKREEQYRRRLQRNKQEQIVYE